MGENAKRRGSIAAIGLEKKKACITSQSVFYIFSIFAKATILFARSQGVYLFLLIYIRKAKPWLNAHVADVDCLTAFIAGVQMKLDRWN